MARRTLVSLLLLAACTAPTEAEELSLRDGEPWDSPGYASIPDGEIDDEAADIPDDRPRIEVSAFGGGDEFHGTAMCPFAVEATGFPAVSVDGETVASFVAETLSSSDGEDEIVTVGWIDVETDARESLVLVDGLDPTITADTEGHCRGLWRKAKREARAANERLAATRWRTLAPVNIPTPMPFDDPDDGEAPEHGVELVRRGGQAIFRIPGVKVLGRAEMKWSVRNSEACEFGAYPSEVFGDRETGVIAIEVSQYAAPCFCYAETLFHAMRVPDALFDAL